MLTISNSLSFIRAPLAFLFLIDNTALRLFAVIAAMVTDSIDGFIARRSNSVSRFGAILDPVMDKFFVYFVLSVLFIEDHIYLWQGFAMISRDFFLLIYAGYLMGIGKLKNYQVRAIRWGKVTTAMQFIVLSGVILGYIFPWYIFVTFIMFGALAFFELLQTGLETP